MSKQEKKIVLKKLKELDVIWHPETTLVFRSVTDKVVTGRIYNGSVIPLDDEAIELCAEWKFKYDQDLLENGNEDTDSDNDNDKETDEEKSPPKVEAKIVAEEKIVEKVVEKVVEEKVVVKENVVISVDENVEQFMETFKTLVNIGTVDLQSRLSKYESDFKRKIESMTKELESVRQELDETKTKLSNIKKMLGM